MVTSLDGYAEAAEGGLGTGADDPEVHTFVNDLFHSVGTYLYGRRMYETMVYWERAHTEPDPPPHVLQYARDRQAAEKIVYSTTLESVSSAKTRIERTFDPDAVRELKAAADHDLTVDGPDLAAQAIAAGLVDEYHLFITTSVVGGGKRFFPDGVRLDLALVEERAFDSISRWSRSVPSTADRSTRATGPAEPLSSGGGSRHDEGPGSPVSGCTWPYARVGDTGFEPVTSSV
ncbi:dihydrofolate reductase family protein [Geodermatophilus amargosae]|uniref:dihydrofolate reductase family protein n=1 Tax=Geodermatophilus amargosae TaxID=1296565 RepID=UPI001FE2F13A|nr:dihydrofolate reductase family protein [Geodermatophilus amargosae]